MADEVVEEGGVLGEALVNKRALLVFRRGGEGLTKKGQDLISNLSSKTKLHKKTTRYDLVK